MTKTLNILAGVTTIGNSLDLDNVIENLATADIDSFKTLVGGIWKSWTNGAPIDFQGFDTLVKGLGYVVRSQAATSITLLGSPLDPNDISVVPGLTMLGFPYTDRPIGSGYIPRLSMDSIKTIDGTWKSWSAGAPVEFQGFTTLDDTKGYVCNILDVFGTYLSSSNPNSNEGVRFDISDTMVTDGVTIEGVTYTDPNAVGSINFDKVDYDPTIPATIMFFSINGVEVKVDFASELLGQDFYIINSGITYRGIFVENEDYANPTAIVDTLDLSLLEISYEPTGYDNTLPMLEMNLTIDGIRGVIEFATEYTGRAFNAWVDGEIVEGTFTEGDVTLTTV